MAGLLEDLESLLGRAQRTVAGARAASAAVGPDGAAAFAVAARAAIARGLSQAQFMAIAAAFYQSASSAQGGSGAAPR